MADNNQIAAAFLAAFAQARNDHSTDAQNAHMAGARTFMASVGSRVEGSKFVSREQLRAGFASPRQSYPDAHFEAVGTELIVGDRDCAEWIFTATKKSDGS